MSVIPLAGPAERRARHDSRAPTEVEVVLPVHNEAEQLAASVTRLRGFLDESFPLTARIVIVDNASTDRTYAIACRLAGSMDGVDALRLEQKGRGRALRAAWSAASAPVVAYMDVDLATDLDAFLPLVAPLLSGHSDVAIGSRLAPGAHVVRTARRELLSRAYNLLVRAVLGANTSDAQCGFKALRREVANELLSLVEDDEWFFDTELLVVAERLGFRIHEVPVDWTDDLDSRVAVLRTAWLDLCGVTRLARPAARRAARRARRYTTAGAARRDAAGDGPPSEPPVAVERPASDQMFADELLRFAGVGVVSTLAYLGLVVALRPWVGIELANVTALAACSLGNTALHRRLVRRRGAPLPDHHLLVGAALMGVSLAGTTAALLGLRAAGVTGLGPELAALTVANLAASVVRFGVLRTWVFRPRFGVNVAAGLPSVATMRDGTDAA
jgi:putative flippase GtrA